MNEIRVLHLISGGDTGGAKTHVINLINGLNDKVFTLLVTLMESDFTEDAKKSKLPLTVLHQKSRFDLSVVDEISRLIEENKINVIHIHGARANFIVTFVKKKHPDMPIVTTIHSDYLLDDYRGGKLVSFVFRKINAWALRKMDYYIGVSDRFKDMMITRGFGTDNRVFSVYNGLDFNKEIIIEREKEAFLLDYNVDANESITYVGIMGRLDPVKNHKLFIEIAKEVTDENKNFRFLIAGEGKLEEELKELSRNYKIDEYIHFLGFIDRPYEFYNAIDINVLTSLSESFPYVMLEGARMKKPIVTTDVGGVRHVVKNGKTGYVVENHDVDDFSNKIIELSDDRTLREGMGEEIYKIVNENFSMDRFIQNHIEIYNEILEDIK